MPNITIPLVHYTFAGLQKKLKLCFGSAPLVVTEAQLRDLLRDEKGIKSYPITHIKVRNAAYNDEGIRANKIGAQSGIRALISSDGDHATRIAVIPARLDLEFNYFTDNFEDSLSFVAKWLHTGLKNRLNFSMTYMGVDFDIVTVLDAQITIPEKESLMSENPDYFQFTTNMYLNTYLTNEDSRDMQEVPLIRDVTVRYNPQISQ